MKTATIAALAMIAGLAPASAALAVDAPAPAAAPAPAYSTETTDIGTLVDTPATKAVLDKYLPGFSTNPQIEMARAMTLRQIQGFAADILTDDALGKVDQDLAKIAKAN
ncbi:hypothetical protein ACFOD9_07600 [Novosphingobium bradum]|uniref:DUF3300 domain-containing protein n=1 Tax=Novosphingobium bradum TaxID=1737444 RepID=A0ABV7INB0_9SPHN